MLRAPIDKADITQEQVGKQRDRNPNKEKSMVYSCNGILCSY